MHKLQKKNYWFQLAFPIVLAVAVTWITLHPFFEISYRTPFLCYFGIIFVSAAYGGSRSSIVATLACVVFSFIFILPQYKPNSEFFAIGTCIFLAEGLLLSGLFRRIEKFQQRLLESEQRFRGIIEKSAEGILMTDKNGLIEYVSPSVSALLGSNSDVLLKQPVQNLIHPDEFRIFDEQIGKLARYEIAEMEFLVRIKVKDGYWKWIEGFAMDLRKEEFIRSFVFQFRDVNSRVELERQKEDFVHIASHELKTPVTSIKGFIQVLKKRHQKEQREEDIAIIERVEKQSEKLVHLIEDLLDVTRIKNGELSYHFGHLDLKAFIPEVIAAHEVIYPGHTFEFSAFGPALIYGDRERISQVISNLLTNAIKYSPGKNRVEINITKEKGCIKTTIKDEGVGIPASQQEKIFDRFYRISTVPNDTFPGLGIGLHISNEIIKGHQGKMGVKSEEGRGSEFWFTLTAV